MHLICMLLWFTAVFIQSIAKQCTSPELPPFSKPRTPAAEHYDENTHFYYECIHNYHFEQRGTPRHKIVCSNGQWQPTPWKCTDDCNNRCEHGTCEKTVDAETRETVASCLCQKNYAGEKCDARVCEILPLKPHHVFPRASMTTIGDGKFPLASIVTFSCVEGYAIKSGRTQAKCKPGGWDPVIPDCEEIVCPGLKFPHGTHTPDKSSYKVGDRVDFDCLSGGYNIMGGSYSFCRNGFWIPKWPACVIPTRVCPNPPKIQYGFMISPSHRSYTVGSAVRYRCHTRYYMEGKTNYIKCKHSHFGEFWDNPPRCYPIDACGDSDKIIEKRADGQIYCVSKGPLITTTVSSTVKPLTIVTATAGALLLLLLIVISLVAYQRRRIAITNRRQNRVQLENNDNNDRFSFVYYTNDVHVVLPSYDEAVGTGAPPPYGGTDGSPDSADSTENVSEQGREAGVGSEEENTEAIYEVIDETLHANLVRGQPGAGHTSGPSTHETDGHTSTSTDSNDSNVLHKEMDTTEQDIDSVISLNIDDPGCDDTAPLIED